MWPDGLRVVFSAAAHTPLVLPWFVPPSRFQLLTIALRFAYGFVEFMIPVVLCATAIRYTDNPSRIEFDLR